MKNLLLFLALFLSLASVSAQTLPAYIPSTGLIAWYPFTGNANDSSGFGHNGTDSGATLTTDRFGNANCAYLFNGSSSKIVTHLMPPTGDSARTITLWFKYNALVHPCGDYGLCIAGYGGDNRGCSYADRNFSLELYYRATGPAGARVDGICIANDADTTGGGLDTSWHFFAASYAPSYGDFTNIKIYIDGNFKSTTTEVYGGITSVITDTFSHFDIGAGHYDCPRYFDGKIDDIGVWNRALTAAEIYGMYHTVPTARSDSFSVFARPQCSGPSFYVLPRHHTSTLSVNTLFGDGSSETDTFPAVCGDDTIGHTYSNSGMYTVKHILLDGGSPIDSVQYSYSFNSCTVIPVQLYFDANSDCIKDSGEHNVTQPVLVEIDSNGLSVDTISATCGFYYNAYGPTGTIYSFRVISSPSGFSVTCPASGVVHDTLATGAHATDIQYLGFSCGTRSAFDLCVNAVVPVTGVNDQWGDIYVQNADCMPTDGTLTLHYSHKYMGTPTQVTPTADSVLPGKIVWSLSSLSSTGTGPVMLHWEGEHGSTPLTIGDTVQCFFTINPITGDDDTINNNQIIIDTVKAGCDPNEMWVSPASCIDTSVKRLQYTINFENTGNDTAHNIYILDTLSANVDISSFRLVMASHNMFITKIRDAAGDNILKFDFPGINLLDSSYHGQCNGALIFTVLDKPRLAVGANITNRAGIYFDVNPVVMTNQVQNNVNYIDTPTIAITLSGHDTVCAGTTVTFSASITNGGSAPAYMWAVNGSLVSSAGSTFAYAPANNDSVTCTLISNASCINTSGALSNTLHLFTDSIVTPVISIASMPGDTVCSGTPVTFSASIAGGGASPTYLWAVNSSIVSSTGASYTYTPSSYDSVTCTLLSSATCLSSTSVPSNVVHLFTDSIVTPGISIVSSTGDTVCAGTLVTYNSLATGGGTTPAYEWLINGVASGTATGYTYHPANGDSIICELISFAQCAVPDSVFSNAIKMVVNDTGMPTISLSGPSAAPLGSSVTINATISGAGSSYLIHWLNSGIEFTATTVPTVTYTKVQATDSISARIVPDGACYDSSVSGIQVVTKSNTSVPDAFATQEISLFPNPANTEVFITGNFSINSIVITDLLGQQVLQQTVNAMSFKVDISNLSGGVYNVIFNSNYGRVVKKLVKE